MKGHQQQIKPSHSKSSKIRIDLAVATITANKHHSIGVSSSKAYRIGIGNGMGGCFRTGKCLDKDLDTRHSVSLGFLRTGYHQAARRFHEERTTEIHKRRTSNMRLLKREERNVGGLEPLLSRKGIATAACV